MNFALASWRIIESTASTRGRSEQVHGESMSSCFLIQGKRRKHQLPSTGWVLTWRLNHDSQRMSYTCAIDTLVLQSCRKHSWRSFVTRIERSSDSSLPMSSHSIYQTERWHSSNTDSEEGSVYSSNTVNTNLLLKDTKRQVASISQKFTRSVSGLIGTERKGIRRHSRRASGGDKNDESMKFYQHVQGYTDVGSRRRFC